MTRVSYILPLAVLAVLAYLFVQLLLKEDTLEIINRPVPEFSLPIYNKDEGQTLTRDPHSRDVWESAYDGLGRSIDVRIGRLRSKLGDDAKRSRWIKSERGVGYLFVEPED